MTDKVTKGFATISIFAYFVLCFMNPAVAKSHVISKCKGSLIESANRIFEYKANVVKSDLTNASTDYQNYLPNRPMIMTIIIDHDGGTFMQNYAAQRAIAQSIVDSCPQVGGVSFAVQDSENESVVGLLLNSQRVKKFPCSKGVGSSKIQWGSQICSD